ncbi:hypothetical protein LshimejAT787_0504970 [Lyophyllum shimeji]|uniref:Uncharacterized protein n=1 Tax=Lyophyllum shimeji TaxID=47721 RepID=A0A9P3PLP7_LYOSH|nr:hypothetical protein LshimejAT787_0504970 [Lyophyllum shimeji]
MPANQHHTEYAPPVLRAPSPASSIGTTYGEDQTSFSDSEEQLSQSAFEKKWEERIGLGMSREEEIQANREPLLPRPPPGSAEEYQLYMQVMVNLHGVVQNLEENELFEQTLLRGSQAALEPQPSTTDIDALMRSMMVTPKPSTSGPAETGHTRGRSDSRTSGATNGPTPVNGRDVETAMEVDVIEQGYKATVSSCMCIALGAPRSLLCFVPPPGKEIRKSSDFFSDSIPCRLPTIVMHIPRPHDIANPKQGPHPFSSAQAKTPANSAHSHADAR